MTGGFQAEATRRPLARSARAGAGEGTPGAFARTVFERLGQSERIDPVGLADLFLLSFDRGVLQDALADTLQAFLLRRTVEHACAHVPFYRDQAYRRWLETTDPGALSLEGLPILDRDAVADAHAALVAGDVTLRSICHTSGTTGRTLEVFKSFEEVEFVNRFFSRLFAPVIEAETGRPITLTLPTPHHGVPIPVPAPGLTLAGGVTDDTLIRDAARVLTRPYDLPGFQPRVTFLSGMAFQVLFFTSYLLEQGIDLPGLGLKGINIAGGFVPRHWLRFLARAWQAPVQNRFTLTEAFGGASLCSHCGDFRLDPFIVAEVVDVDTGRPLDEGIGRLLVTSLYPFVQMQPFLRYQTGDLVECTRRDCDRRPVFRFLGRLKHACRIETRGRREWLLFSADLHEILATLPDVQIYEWFSNVRAVRDRTVGALPLVSWKSEVDQTGRLHLRISLELKYAPHCYPERTAELREIITAGLKAAPGTVLARELEAGAVELHVTFHPPGGLPDPYVIKV